MPATIIVTAADPDSLIETAGALDWDAEKLDDGRVRVHSFLPDETPERLVGDVVSLGNRFGVTAWEPVA